jgi:hypothetical protein
MNDLVRSRLLPAPAADPAGYVYFFNAQGKAEINPASPLFKEQSVKDKLP